jgi:hypothetical protein
MAQHNAQQPGLRSFIVYGEMPEGCIAIRIDDNRAAPHVRPGDVVIVDPRDREPMPGEMFVIEWMNGKRQVVETRKQRLTVHPRDGGAAERQDCWFAEWQMTIHGLGGGEDQTQRWADGPYSENALTEKLVGRIVGIFDQQAAATSQQPADLLETILAACAAHRMPVSRFGRRAVGDPRLVHDIELGRTPRPTTANRIAAFIANMGRA